MNQPSLLKQRANRALSHILRELWDDLPGIEDERRATNWEGLIGVWVLDFCIKMRDQPRPASRLVPLLNRYVRRCMLAAGVPQHFTAQDMAAVQFDLTRGLLIGLGYFESRAGGPVEMAHAGYYLTLAHGIYMMTWEMGTPTTAPAHIPRHFGHCLPQILYPN